MKKLLSILIAVIFGLGLNAQTTAPDFTATDYFGDEIHLYEILEGGQYVLLHVNTRTNGATPTVTPALVEAYKNLGCNQHDVFFVGIVPNGTTSATQKYVEEYGIEFPMIHNTDDSYGMEGPAMDIWQALQCEMPTTMLIAPDKSIALDDIASIETAEDVITALAAFGIQEYECGEEPETAEPIIDITVGEVTYTTVEATFTPVGECASYIILLSTEAEMQQWITWMGASLEQLIESWGGKKTGTAKSTWNKLIPNTEYTLYALSKDAEGNTIQLDTKKVSTAILGGEGVSIIDLKVEVKTTTSVFVTATPNEETSEYHYILIEKLYADSIGVDSTMQILHEDPYALYDIDEWEWIDLTAETEYFAIAQGKNVNGEWGEITKIEFKTTLEGTIEIVENNFNIYPNPATTSIIIEGAEEGMARIFDMTGRCVKEVNVVDNTTVNIEDLNKGVYIININNKVEKLVVK
ncbi:MAG: T9SS type A sorting domain-containing protein [Bacteroidales bacterium]|nr:T9SS type A sorting domain-containing protein [Bacteroidales bacterium]MBR5782232.1 T9SS type A sorting domain-containing protein [Bacteroidales bacterium]